MDQILDKDYGHLLEEILVELRQESRYIFTTTNFSNVGHFARWIATIYQTPCHFVRVKKRPFKFNFNISIPQDMNSMQIFPLSKNQDEFTVDEEVFKTAMQEFYTPKNESDMADFVEKCNTTFPVRLTVQKLFHEQQSAIVVVVFDDNHSILYANHLQAMTQINAASMANVNQILQEFHGRLDNASEEFQFLLRITPMFLKGVAYMNKNMPPIIREMVETLFHRKLLLVLVITEEIAINSLVRTQRIVISSCRKFGGNAYNYLTNYEWQRLLCFKPNLKNSTRIPEVTLILDWKMSQETLEQIVLPQTTQLHTSMLNRTEQQLQNDESGLSFYRFLKKLEKKRAAIEASEVATRLSELDESQFNTNIRDFIKLETELDELKKQIDEKSFIPSKIVNYLSCGRLIRVIDGEKDFGVGIVITYEPSFDECPENGSLFVALKIARDSCRNVHDFQLLSPAHKDELMPLKEDDFPSAPIKIVKIPLEFVKVVFASRIKLPSSLRDKKELNFLYTLLNNLRKYRLKKVQIDDPELNVLHQKLKEMKEELKAKPVQHREGFEAEKQQLKEFYTLGKQAEKTQKIKEEYNTMPFFMS
ncbi:hypothetical protein M3Y97_00971700 [Aphelenchoides bicaudatus]|nr:hypothetical protein M3Y97_00971700 [Aphelenchoides bicaudatus]